MVHVDIEKIAVVGGAVAVVTALFLVQKHTTPHPRRSGRAAGGRSGVAHTLHNAVPGVQGRTALPTQRAPSHSRSRTASSHRSRRGQRHKTDTTPPSHGTPEGGTHGGVAPSPHVPAHTTTPAVRADLLPTTPLTATALHQHRQREGKARAVEEHLEGAAAVLYGGLEHATTVSNAATTGTSQNADEQRPTAAARVAAARTPPALSLPAAGAEAGLSPEGDSEKRADSAPRSRKHTARPKSAWKHSPDAQQGASPAPQSAIEQVSVRGSTAAEPHRPPTLPAAATTTRAVPAAVAPNGELSPPDRSHSFLHLSDLGFSPITPAQRSHVTGGGDSATMDGQRKDPAAAAATTPTVPLPAPLSVLALLEQELDALVQQVADAKGSPASWMALYVLVHQVPLAVLRLCYESIGALQWRHVLTEARSPLTTADASITGFTEDIVARLEGSCELEDGVGRHYEWAASKDGVAVERKASSQLSHQQREWSLRLPSATATTLTVDPSRPSSSTVPRPVSPSRFAALRVSSSSSSSASSTHNHLGVSTHPTRDDRAVSPSSTIGTAYLTTLAEKYRYLVVNDAAKGPEVRAARTPVETPLDPVAEELIHAFALFRSLKESTAFAALRRQPEYAVFACDFVDALAQAQRALDHGDSRRHGVHTNRVTLPLTERRVAAPHPASGAMALHAGEAPSFNFSRAWRDETNERHTSSGDRGARVRALSRVSSDDSRSPLQPRKPQMYGRTLSTSALAHEAVSPPTSRTVPAKAHAKFERSRTDGNSPSSHEASRERGPSNVFERLYTPPKTSPKASPPKHHAKEPFRLYDLSHAPSTAQ